MEVKKRFSALVAVALLVAGVVTFYVVNQATAESSSDDSAAKAADEEKTPIPVRTVVAATGDVSSYISATANLVAEHDVTVLSEWEGRIERLSVEEGDRVAAGQVLATLARTDGEIAVDKARIRAADSRQQHERAARLAAQDLLAPDALDKLRLEMEISDHELAEAQWNLEKTQIRAPFTGHVTKRHVQLGGHVRRGDELFAVTAFDPLIARVYLPETDVLHLIEGQQVKLTLKADESVQVGARIRQISPVVDTSTGTVKVTVEANDPPEGIRPGSFVRVDVVRETRHAALLIPKEAIVRELQKAYVFVALDGVAARRLVSLGLEEAGRIETTSGVEPGEAVIVAGQGGLKDGSPIELLATPEDAPVARDRTAAVAR